MNESFLLDAYKIARRSDDPNTHNGAILAVRDVVIGTGYNFLVKGAHIDPDRFRAPAKYHWMFHAEQAAILDAFGALPHLGGLVDSLHGSTLYCPWAACSACARWIVQVGIARVVTHSELMNRTPDRWKEEIEQGNKILRAGNVRVEQFSGQLGVTHLFGGEKIQL